MYISYNDDNLSNACMQLHKEACACSKRYVPSFTAAKSIVWRGASSSLLVQWLSWWYLWCWVRCAGGMMTAAYGKQRQSHTFTKASKTGTCRNNLVESS
jgi:hypothetical protein